MTASLAACLSAAWLLSAEDPANTPAVATETRSVPVAARGPPGAVRPREFNQRGTEDGPAIGTIRGIVRAESSGRALSGARVVAAEASAITDANGAFVLHDVRPGPVVLVARHERGLGFITGLIVPSGGMLDGLDIYVTDAYQLTGKVFVPNHPVPTFSVRAGNQSTSVAEDGTYHLWLYPGEYQVLLVEDRSAEGLFGAGQGATVRMDRDVVLDFDLSQRFPISVLVHDERGAPVSDVSVQAVQVRENRPDQGRCSTNAQGRCEIQGAQAGEISLGLSVPGFSSSTHHVSATSREVLLELSSRVSTIRGTVLDMAGRPVSAVVQFQSPADTEDGGGLAVLADENGRFSLLLKSSEAWDLHVRSHAPDSPELHHESFAPGTLAHADELDIVVDVPDVPVRGLVVDAEGRPCPRPTITAQARGAGNARIGPREPIRGGVDGTFRIDGIPLELDVQIQAICGSSRGRAHVMPPAKRSVVEIHTAPLGYLFIAPGPLHCRFRVLRDSDLIGGLEGAGQIAVDAGPATVEQNCGGDVTTEEIEIIAGKVVRLPMRRTSASPSATGRG